MDQCSESNAADVKEIAREKRKTQNNYTDFFHNTIVVQFPLHFQGDFHYYPI